MQKGSTTVKTMNHTLHHLSRLRIQSVIFAFIVALAITTCRARTTPTVPPITTSTVSPTPTSTPLAAHRIQVRVINGVGEFYDTVTGEKFVPRGMNYNRFL